MPLGPQGVCFPGVKHGLNALAQPRRIVIEVDERAAIGYLDPARSERYVGRLAVGLIEQIGLVDEGVGPVEPITPALEGADESRPTVPAILDELHATVAARVVICAHRRLVHPHDDDRLVEDLVFDVVTGVRDFSQAACHLPDMGPQELALHGIELRVVVSLGGDTVSPLHCVRDRKSRS